MPDPQQTRLTIAVATFRRPDGLRTLIESLDALSPVPEWAAIDILVVDNDPLGETPVDREKLQACCRWPITVQAEPRQGIVHARNRILDAVPASTEIVGFLDDDETVSPQWAQEMLATLAASDAAAVQGPVEPAFQQEAPLWVEQLGFFRLGPFADRAPLTFASTNNSCIRAGAIRALNLRFDPAFNDTGGEDEDFFFRLQDNGFKIVAAARAVVYDQVPAHRMTRSWHLTRARRMGNTLGRIAIKSGHGRLTRVVKGIGQIALGCTRAFTVGCLSATERMRGMTTAARGLGSLQAFASVTVREYSPSAVRLDRQNGKGSLDL